ncbi:hypothetical protein DFAR_3220008 [Desulfarculales bacterium]
MPGTTWSVVNGRGYCGTSAPSGGKSPFFIASGCRALPSWDGSGSTARVTASWNLPLPHGQEWPGGSRALDEDTAQALTHLRRALPTESVTTLISETMRPTPNLARHDPQGAHRLPLPAPAGADGQTDRSTCRPQALRGRTAQRHLAA